MECLEYALLEWGLRLSVPLARRETDVQREYYYPLGRQGPVETRSRIYDRARPNWARPRALRVIVRHRSRKKRRCDFTQYVFEIELKGIYSENVMCNEYRSIHRSELKNNIYTKRMILLKYLKIYAISNFVARKILQVTFSFYTS